MQTRDRFDVVGGPNTASLVRLTSSGGTGATVDVYASSVAPEGVITAGPGSMCYASVGGSGRAYVKTSGAGNTGWLLLTPGGVPITPVTQLGSAATVGIAAGVEVVAVPSTNFTVPAGATGFATITATVHLSMGAVILSPTNTVNVLIYVDGVADAAATATKSLSGVTLTLDSEPVVAFSFQVALAAGVHTMEARAARPAGAGSTAALVGTRRLHVE